MEEKNHPLSDLPPEQEQMDAGSSAAEAHHNGLYPDRPDASGAVELAMDWIRENQEVAMLGAFGLGVFLGVLIRR